MWWLSVFNGTVSSPAAGSVVPFAANVMLPVVVVEQEPMSVRTTTGVPATLPGRSNDTVTGLEEMSSPRRLRPVSPGLSSSCSW